MLDSMIAHFFFQISVDHMIFLMIFFSSNSYKHIFDSKDSKGGRPTEDGIVRIGFVKKINEKNVSLGDIERECKVNIYILRQLFNTVYDLEGRKINTVYFACERERE